MIAFRNFYCDPLASNKRNSFDVYCLVKDFTAVAVARHTFVHGFEAHHITGCAYIFDYDSTLLLKANILNVSIDNNP